MFGDGLSIPNKATGEGQATVTTQPDNQEGSMATDEEKQQVLNEVVALRSETAGYAERLTTLRELIEGQMREDPLPKTFIGIARYYRFSNRADDGKFGKPTHKFEVECGAGLWLYVSATGEMFERLMEGLPLEEFTSVEEMLNGKVVSVKRLPNQNSLVPVMMLGEPYRLRDARGRVLFEGASVRHVAPEYSGVVVGEDEDQSEDSRLRVRSTETTQVNRLRPSNCIRE